MGADRVTWSPELYALFGVDPGGFEPTYEGFMEAVHAGDRERVTQGLRAAMDGETPYAVAHRIVRPDGRERLVICRAQLMRDPHGRPIRMVGAMVDLSEYRGVADNFRARQEQLDAAEDLAGIASFEWDVTGDTVTWSDGMYSIFGIDPGDFAGTYAAYLDLIHPEDRLDRETQVAALLSAGDTLEGELRMLRADGEVRTIASKLRALRDEGGTLRSVIGVCRDVTE
jgi:PAS domain S-box-containing protein